jgi:hypothetical protein
MHQQTYEGEFAWFLLAAWASRGVSAFHHYDVLFLQERISGSYAGPLPAGRHFRRDRQRDEADVVTGTPGRSFPPGLSPRSVSLPLI